MVDSDLALVYGVTTKAFNQAVKRNVQRFPEDFMFRVTPAEVEEIRARTSEGRLRSQSVTSNIRGGRRYVPYVFTEQGVAMLSSVLRSPRAIRVNVEIMRAFVHMRRMTISHVDLARRIDAIEETFDARFRVVFTAIRKVIRPRQGRRIGFAR